MGLGSFSVEDWVVIGVATLVASCLALHFLKASKRSRLPPGPPKWPIVGNLPQLAKAGKLPHRATMELAKTYGPVMLLTLGASNMLYITDPKIAEDCLKGSVFINRPIRAANSYLNYFGDSHAAAAPYGEFWRHVKKLVHTELLSSTRLKQFEGLRLEETQAVVREFLEASKGNVAVHVRRSLDYLMMNNLTRMTMSRKFCLPAGAEAGDGRSEAKVWLDSVEGIFELYMNPMMKDIVPALAWVDAVSGLRSKMRMLHDNLDKILQRILDARKQDLLDRRRTENETRDFLDVMLLSDGGRALSETAIKATIMDLVGAGTETTATATEWALSELLANPDLMKKAQQEVDQVVGTKRVVRESDVENMPYLQAVVRETFRLRHGPWGLPRSSAVESQVQGYDIPADCALMIQMWAMGRDPAVWEDPLKFDPERFLGSKAEDMMRKMAFSPFGLGKRMCPGYKLGDIMVHYVLARLIHSFDWSLPNGIGHEQLDMEETIGMTLQRRTPLTAVVKPRLPIHLY